MWGQQTFSIMARSCFLLGGPYGLFQLFNSVIIPAVHNTHTNVSKYDPKSEICRLLY